MSSTCKTHLHVYHQYVHIDIICMYLPFPVSIYLVMSHVPKNHGLGHMQSQDIPLHHFIHAIMISLPSKHDTCHVLTIMFK